MPPKTLFDISQIDLNHVLHDQEFIRSINPQRGDMEQLNGIVYVNSVENELIGFKDVRDNEFWVPGHIPGRPLLPGVLMLEAAAQLASFYTKHILKWTGFIGFGGLEDVKFRMAVPPGVRLYILTKQTWHRHRRVCCQCQGMVDGAIVFEAGVIGTQM
jgi:3-hydroxyacyl-[acyl-carrier-protein] dehydratase